MSEDQVNMNLRDATEDGADAVTDVANDVATDLAGGMLSAPSLEQHQTADHLMSRGPGAQMARQRESFGWTIEHAASQLNLAPRQIIALEAENYAALPGMASARGFVRSYAKLLKLDADALLAQIAPPSTAALVEPLTMRRALSAPFFDDSRMSAMGMQGPSNKTNFLLPGLVLLVVGLFGGYHLGWLPQLPNLLAPKIEEPVLAAEATTLAAPLSVTAPEKKGEDAASFASASASASAPELSGAPVDATSAVGRVVQEPLKAVAVTKLEPVVAAKASPEQNSTAGKTPTNLTNSANPTNPATVTKAVTPVVPVGPAVSVVPPPVAQKTAVAAGTAATSTSTSAQGASGKAVLTVKFREDSWIDLRRADNNIATGVLIAHVGKAGTTETFDLADAHALTIGNVNGVDVSLRGNAVDMKSTAKNNVVRLILK